MKTLGKTILFYATFSFCALFIITFNTGKKTYRDPINHSPNHFVESARIKFSASTDYPKIPSQLIESSCECVSSRTGKSYDFCYQNPKNTSLIGKRFDCSYLSTIEDLKLVDSPESTLVDLSNSRRNSSDVIFVSAISTNHLGNFEEAYALIKRHWPNQLVILYSLDLSDSRIKDLEKHRNVKIRKFDYSKYPSYVKNWHEYRFKAIILAEIIRDYSNVWWIDAHTRWLAPKPLDVFYKELADCTNNVDCEKKSSLMMFINSTHSNYAVLTEGLLDYFPTYGIDTLKTNEKGLQLSAMFVYLARTPFTLEILKWHTLCALEETCMNPPTAKLKCDIIPAWEVYAGCFRYDQSSLNILMFNSFRDHNDYFMDAGKLSRTYAHY